MTMTKTDAERRLAEIGPQALKLVRETRDTIALCLRIGAKDNDTLLPKLRRDTLAYIRQCKHEYRQLRAALENGIFD